MIDEWNDMHLPEIFISSSAKLSGIEGILELPDYSPLYQNLEESWCLRILVLGLVTTCHRNKINWSIFLLWFGL